MKNRWIITDRSYKQHETLASAQAESMRLSALTNEPFASKEMRAVGASVLTLERGNKDLPEVAGRIFCSMLAIRLKPKKTYTIHQIISDSQASPENPKRIITGLKSIQAMGKSHKLADAQRIANFLLSEMENGQG